MARAFATPQHALDRLAGLGLPFIPDADYYHNLIWPPDCGSCPLQLQRKVIPDGPLPAKLCIVGEEPGPEELTKGHGFIGASGRLIWQWGAHYGIRREDTWVSNARLCRTRNIRLRSGALLDKDTVGDLASKACRRRLIAELLVVTRSNPDAVIVLVGNTALRTLSRRPKAKVFAYRGSVMRADLERLWLENTVTIG